jgi:putative membrane-bound dehydrogenase-like protein
MNMSYSRTLLAVFLVGSAELACTVVHGQPKDSEDPSAVKGQGTASVVINDVTFDMPNGYQLQRVASEPLVKWPVVADWDAQGRLVVVESAGVARPIEEHNKQLLHRIVRLIDDNGDGQFDRRLLAADRLPFSEGILCLGKDLLVAAPPHIWKLTDEDGDGYCEDREVWFDGQTITGCANDLHGPYLGRDGWIYWCKGAFAEQTHELLDGSVLKDSAAHIYRRKMGGGPIEPVMSGGMDNPVEMAVTPEGERFFTSTFLQHPGNGRRDGIAHAVYGGVYGKDQSAIAPLIKTGPLMPIMTHLGAAAPSGLACLEINTLWPADDPGQRTLVAALFNLQKVTAHRIAPEGATFVTENVDLVVADRVDFHPTDILEDADGSLLIIDTGGWYDLCCPTSRVDQKTASGGIYRLSRKSDRQAPELARIPDSWEDLPTSRCVQLLDDSRPWIARRARLVIADRGVAPPQLVQRLADESLDVDQRLRCLWALCGVGGESALASIAESLAANHPSLVQAACHAISVHRYQPARPQLERLIAGGGQETPSSAAVVRAACEALGRLGNQSSVPTLVERAATASNDRVLEHSALYALLEINAPAALVPFLHSQLASERRVALQLLDTLKAEDYLQPEQVLQSLVSRDAAESRMAAAVLGRHPDWCEAAMPTIAEQWQQQLRQGAQPSRTLGTVLAAWHEQPAAIMQIADWMTEGRTPAARLELLDLLARFEAQPLPQAWVAPLADWLAEDPAGVANCLNSFDLTPAYCQPLQETLNRLISDTSDFETQLRLLAALPVGSPVPSTEIADRLVREFVNDASVDRQPIGQLLMRLRVGGSAAQRLADQLPQLASRELGVAVEAIANSGVDDFDRQMLRQLVDLPAARGLTSDQLTNLYRNRSKDLLELAQATARTIEQPAEDIERQVAEVLASLLPGDPVRGLQVFRSNKAACIACHQMGYVGGKIGPELTRIGRSRTREAILEAILFPSSRIEQSYQPLRVLTESGQVYNGLVTRMNDDALELQVTADKSVIVPLDEIVQQETGQISIMPSGVKDLLTEQELADLLALLQSAN